MADMFIPNLIEMGAFASRKVRVRMDAALLNVLKKSHRENVVFYGESQDEARHERDLKENLQIYYMDLDEMIQADNEVRIDSFEHATIKKIDAFVIMRQLIGNQGTFIKMMDYCERYGAGIYDERGRNLLDVCNRARLKSVSEKENILKEIEKYDYISFDIFDTLLTRKVLLPEDVFELTSQRMAKGSGCISHFVEKRKEVQDEFGLSNPNIYDIYKRLRKKYRIKNEVANQYLKMEIAIEKEVLTVRSDILEIYNKCLEMGKKVFLISDMYISSEIMKDILSDKGIEGYSGLYISCDSKKLKLQGLFEQYRLDIGGVQCLHIGDHRIHDGICAELAGIRYCLIDSCYKKAMDLGYKNCIENAHSLEERVMLGMIISKMLNSPFVDINRKGQVGIDSDYDYAYFFCAALMIRFTVWIYHEIEAGGFDEVLFCSRDGFLIMKMYRKLIQKLQSMDVPWGRYFYTSRKAAVMTCINNEAFINMLIDISDKMTPRKIMAERFGLSESQILKYDEEKYGDSIHKYVWDHAPAIFKRSEKAKLNYYKYMGHIGLQIGGKYALMDFVSSGTTQKSLCKIVPFQLSGLFAGWNGSEDMKEIGVHALFSGQGSVFMRRYKFVETFMTCMEPSLSHFDDQGNPVFSKQDRNEKELVYVKEMQQACLDYLDELMQLTDINEKNITNVFADSVFALSENAYVKDRNSVLNHLKLVDNWKMKSNMVRDLYC